jgi:glycosyltransferase involved in cell wall biosynthesis
VGGLLDLVDEGRTGLLVRPDDPAALAAALESLILSPARAATLGASAREEVTRRYSFDRMVQGFEELYLSQLDAAGAPARSRVSSRAA